MLFLTYLYCFSLNLQAGELLDVGLELQVCILRGHYFQSLFIIFKDIVEGGVSQLPSGLAGWLHVPTEELSNAARKLSAVCYCSVIISYVHSLSLIWTVYSFSRCETIPVIFTGIQTGIVHVSSNFCALLQHQCMPLVKTVSLLLEI